MTLFQHPEQLQQLKADPSLAPAFVKELCRYHTASALAIKRTAKVDIEIGGKVCYPVKHSFLFVFYFLLLTFILLKIAYKGE